MSGLGVDASDYNEYSRNGPLGGAVMTRVHGTFPAVVSAFLSFALLITPAWGAPATGVGTVVSSQQAYLGAAPASVGTTVFNGDRLNTDQFGSVQVRAGAARLLLAGSSNLTWNTEGAVAAATLASGTASFSTADARAFALHVATAVIRPQGDEPTIGNVTVLSPKELVVRCSRGALTVTVEDDSRVIPEGVAYRIVLDTKAADASGNGQPWGQGPPQKAGKSRFMWYLIAFTAVITTFAVSEALESPDRP